MADATVVPERHWLILTRYAVVISDRTGKITFHGYRKRKEAELLAAALRVIVGDRPIGALSMTLARELLLTEPGAGEEWTKLA